MPRWVWCGEHSPLDRWPAHLPDWVFWLLVAVLPAVYCARLVWSLWGPRASPQPTQMRADAVIALVRAAIREQWPDWTDDHLHIAEWPRPANAMQWTVREAMIGSWWIAGVDDASGKVTDLRREGVR
jgi:hypothetical protein